MTQNDIVQKPWNICDVLRDGGIDYSDYVPELALHPLSPSAFGPAYEQ